MAESSIEQELFGIQCTSDHVVVGGAYRDLTSAFLEPFVRNQRKAATRRGAGRDWATGYGKPRVWIADTRRPRVRDGGPGSSPHSILFASYYARAHSTTDHPPPLYELITPAMPGMFTNAPSQTASSDACNLQPPTAIRSPVTKTNPYHSYSSYSPSPCKRPLRGADRVLTSRRYTRFAKASPPAPTAQPRGNPWKTGNSATSAVVSQQRSRFTASAGARLRRQPPSKVRHATCRMRVRVGRPRTPHVERAEGAQHTTDTGRGTAGASRSTRPWPSASSSPRSS